MTNFLDKLSLLSKDKSLSLSNLAIYVILARLIMGMGAWEGIVCVVLIFNYGYKRYVNTGAQKTMDATKRLEEAEATFKAQAADYTNLRNQVNSLAVRLGFK